MAKDQLDLHGYRVEEVESAVDRFLIQISNLNLKKARILTGKGTGKVKAAVIQYLKMAGYEWSYERLPNGRANEGCLIIYVDD